MPSLKKNILTLFLLLIVYTWFFISHQNPKTNPNITGAENNIILFVEPESGRTPILNAINNAQHEILVEMYLLSDKEIIKSLEAARSRGLAVSVMLEKHPFGGGNLNEKTKEELDGNGVSAQWANSSFSLTHEKAIVIDNETVFILNQNLTASSFSKNREFNVIDTNPEDVLLAKEIFVYDWQRRPFSINSSNNLIVSPNTSRTGLETLMKSAAKTIDIEIEIINDSQIVSLLLESAKKIQVRLIAPTLSQINSNKDALKRLRQAGVLIKTLSSPYIHTKLILVDGIKAYTGSVNLSSQSMDQNRELGIIFTEKNSIETINSTFEKDWDKGSEFN